LLNLDASYHLLSTNTPENNNPRTSSSLNNSGDGSNSNNGSVDFTKRRLFEETCQTAASTQLLQTNVLNLSNKFKLINYNSSNGHVANSESKCANAATLAQESFFKTAYASSCRTADKNRVLRSRCISTRSELILDAPDVNDDYCEPFFVCFFFIRNSSLYVSFTLELQFFPK
jgi:hypothetical protein